MHYPECRCFVQLSGQHGCQLDRPVSMQELPGLACHSDRLSGSQSGKRDNNRAHDEGITSRSGFGMNELSREDLMLSFFLLRQSFNCGSRSARELTKQCLVCQKGKIGDKNTNMSNKAGHIINYSPHRGQGMRHGVVEIHFFRKYEVGVNVWISNYIIWQMTQHSTANMHANWIGRCKINQNNHIHMDDAAILVLKAGGGR